MEKEKFILKLNIKDYNNQLEKILSKKTFSEDTKNLLLSMLYQVENSYADYNLANGDTKTKKEILEEILKIIEQDCEKIEIVKTKESKSILEENKIITYLNARKRLDDGSLENEFTLFEIQDDATVKEIGKIANMGTELKYIVNKKAYLSTQQEGTYTINLENNQKETEEKYNDCRFFLGGYGYKINDADINDIKIERIEL